jgi:creatinine amidohydrolase
MAETQGRIWWGDFPAAAFEALDPDAVIAVLPVAAIEQHGPHLPVSTDAEIMRGMLDTVIPLIPEDMDVRILPVQAVGKSNEHRYAPGTLTLPPSLLIKAWTELGASVARAGIRKIVVVTSHGGNEEIMGIVTRELRVNFAMLAVKTSWERFGWPEGMFPPLEQRQGIHGGAIETSLMLHFRPDLVDMTKAQNFASRVGEAEETFELLRQTGKHAFSWIATDLNPHGVVGNAAIATAEKGKAAAEHQAAGFVQLLRDIKKAKLSDWLS